jgi:FAD/FMN-containing dehydrogenase
MLVSQAWPAAACSRRSSEEGEERVRDAYGGEHYARLVELKRRYDADNVFRNNQNINAEA